MRRLALLAAVVFYGCVRGHPFDPAVCEYEITVDVDADTVSSLPDTLTTCPTAPIRTKRRR